jgi:hypothetical protein
MGCRVGNLRYIYMVCGGATLSPRYGQRRVHCGEQIFNDFVNSRQRYK